MKRIFSNFWKFEVLKLICSEEIKPMSYKSTLVWKIKGCELHNIFYLKILQYEKKEWYHGGGKPYGVTDGVAEMRLLTSSSAGVIVSCYPSLAHIVGGLPCNLHQSINAWSCLWSMLLHLFLSFFIKMLNMLLCSYF